MERSTFVESLKRNLATLLNDDDGKAILAPDTSKIRAGEEQVVTVGDYEYSRIAAPVPGAEDKTGSLRPTVTWKGAELGEGLTDEQENGVRATLKDLDTEIRESEYDLHTLLPIAEHRDVRAVRAVIEDLKDEGNPTTFVDVKAAARKLAVTVTIPGDGGNVRFRKV
ncbi:MAG: hypothetical protein IH944_13725 [Armatimonadetes bacterium]|nr:hypothetical protein [Armatimonadota bacterium]